MSGAQFEKKKFNVYMGGADNNTPAFLRKDCSVCVNKGSYLCKQCRQWNYLKKDKESYLNVTLEHKGKIVKNRAECLICNTVVNASLCNQIISFCHCGNLGVSGAITELLREAKDFSKVRERNVFNYEYKGNLTLKAKPKGGLHDYFRKSD